MRITLSTAIAIACISLSACGTIQRGTTDTVKFLSEPPGAIVRVAADKGCVTPCGIVMPRREAFTATFSLAGHEDRKVFVDTDIPDDIEQSMVAGVLMAPLSPTRTALMIVDAASGANYVHTPNPVFVVLKPIDLGQTASGDADAPRD